MKRTLIIIVALVLLGINFASYHLYVRADATQGGIYTLSSSTKNIAKNLDKNYVIYQFASEKLPSQFEIINQQLNDSLDEYVSASKGKLSVKRFDPTNDTELATLAQQLGIPALQMQVFEKDQTQIVKGYMGLAIVSEKNNDSPDLAPPIDPNNPQATPPAEEKSLMDKVEKSESIPVIQNLSTLEYDLTSALKKVSSGSQPVIGFITGHEEHKLMPSRQDQMTQPEPRQDYAFRDTLEKNYRIRDVDLKNAESIKNIDTLILAGPKSALADEEVKAIHDFVASGKNAIFLIDQITLGNALDATPFEEKFTKLLEPYGVEVKANTVADASHTTARFSQGFMSYQIPYNYFLKVSNINKANPITGKLEAFVLPWTSSLSVKPQDKITFDSLALTSDKYTEITENFNFNPNAQATITEDKKSPLPLAVISQKEGQGKVLIIGDSDFASAQFTSQYAGNEVFFLNAIDSFTIGDDLISIRSKRLLDHPIKESVLQSEALKNLIKWGCIILVPTGFIIYGLIRRSVRKGKKKMFA